MLFKSKYPKELEDSNRELVRERDRLKLDVEILEQKLEEIKKLQEKTSDGCVPGKECRLCEFSRGFCITRYASSIPYPESLYICAKSEICPSFITKESVNNA